MEEKWLSQISDDRHDCQVYRLSNQVESKQIPPSEPASQDQGTLASSSGPANLSVSGGASVWIALSWAAMAFMVGVLIGFVVLYKRPRPQKEYLMHFVNSVDK
jgi:hypothetical protein